jgi:predicted alpha/beta-hydrolase family hydrolase
MKPDIFKLQISDQIGDVSAAFVIPENLEFIVTLAHGAGAGMNHPFMTTLAEALAMRGIGSLRFNFPFTEQNKRRPDVPAVAHKTIECAVQQANKLFPAIPLFMSGKSFGGRMSSQLMSEHAIKYVAGLVFYGFPLHPAGKPSTERAEHLKKVKCPMLFLQGTRDELADLTLLEPVVKELKAATLVKIEGADHGFKAGKTDVISILAEETRKFMEERRKVKS